MKLVIPDDPILHRVCRPDFTIRRGTIEGMFWLMHQMGGLGLAAPQVGINARLFVTKWNEVFVNPIPTYLGDSRLVQEGCLSLPGKIGNRRRYPFLRLPDGRVFGGEEALVLQHEIDHLNGILITD